MSRDPQIPPEGPGQFEPPKDVETWEVVLCDQCGCGIGAFAHQDGCRTGHLDVFKVVPVSALLAEREAKERAERDAFAGKMSDDFIAAINKAMGDHRYRAPFVDDAVAILVARCEKAEADRDAAIARADELRVLAERAYPGLKRSGLCSMHHPSQPDDYSCTICFPDLNARVREHMQVGDALVAKAVARAEQAKAERDAWRAECEQRKGEAAELGADCADAERERDEARAALDAIDHVLTTVEGDNHPQGEAPKVHARAIARAVLNRDQRA